MMEVILLAVGYVVGICVITNFLYEWSHAHAILGVQLWKVPEVSPLLKSRV